MLVLLITALVAVSNVKAYDHATSGTCTFEKYEGGDGEVTISPIPKIEAAVPSTLLADMFGKATKEVIGKAGLTATGFMHFGNAAKGIFGMFAKTAPQLGPCLGLLGVGFGFLNQAVNSVSPQQIMTEVNKAIGKVVEATNRQFEVMEEYVDQSVRDYYREAMNDDYRGQFETWKDCLSLGTKVRIDDCQIAVARAVNSLKYTFMLQTIYESDPEREMNKKEIKTLELQLPLLKKWTDFHLLVIGVLVKLYKDDESERTLYAKYKGDLIQDGNNYIGYMEWALRRIRKARIDDNSGSPSWNCGSFDDDLAKWYWFPTDRNMKSTTRRCSFKCTNMKPSYCDLTSTNNCNGHCKLCSGLFCNVDSAMASKHEWLGENQRNKANQLCRSYISTLTTNLDNYWHREIEVFIPTMKEIINDLNDDESDGSPERSSSQTRDDVTESDTDEGKEAQLSDKDRSDNEELNKLAKQKKADEDRALAGTNADMSFTEYLQKVKENTSNLRKKTKLKRKVKHRKQKKTGQ